MRTPSSSFRSGTKTCLVVSHLAPWLGTPGSIRLRKLIMRLQEQGWDLALLTAGTFHDSLLYSDRQRRLVVPLLFARRRMYGSGVSGGTLGSFLRVPLDWIKQALAILVRRVSIPRTYGWFRQWRRILSWCRQVNPDIILSTSPPPSSSWMAKALAAKLGKPWVAEIRDPWADNHEYKKYGLFYDLELRLERRLYATSHAMITVSPQIAADLAGRHGKPVKVINHCFEEAISASSQDYSAGNGEGFNLKTPLEILYTGRLYFPSLMPDMIINSLEEMNKSGILRPGELKLAFYTPNRSMLQAWLKRDHPSVLNYCVLHDPVSHVEALRLQRQCDLLLAIGWFGRGGKGVVTSKLGEYLGAGRPILALAPPDSYMSEILDSVGHGFAVHSTRDCTAFLSHFLQMARRGTHLLPDISSVGQYSCRKQSRLLSQFLRDIAARHHK